MSTLYRYRCSCGHKGRGYSNGNGAIADSEKHLENIAWTDGRRHTIDIQTRKSDGTWVVSA